MHERSNTLLERDYTLHERYQYNGQPNVVVKDFEPYKDVLKIDSRGGSVPVIAYSLGAEGVYVTASSTGAPQAFPSMLLEGLTTTEGVSTVIYSQ